MQTPRRRKLPRELFETRSHAWESLGLGDELLTATLFVYYNPLAGPGPLAAALPAPRPGDRGNAGGSGAADRDGWPSSSSPCGSPASTRRRWRSAAPSLRSCSASPPSRPWPGSSPESSCRARGPSGSANGCASSAARSPARSKKIDLRARFSGGASPKQIEDRLLDAISVPTRYPPSVSLEELDADGVVLRVMATPLRPEEGSRLADEVLSALREVEAPELA